jgi:tyrosine-protein kinase Etk/Wzc
MSSENTYQSASSQVSSGHLGVSVVDGAAESDEISLLDLLLVVVDNLPLLIFGTLGSGVAALVISLMISPTYTAKTQFLPPQQQQSSASALVQALGVSSVGGLSSGIAIKNPADQFIAFMKSQSIQNAMIDRFDLLKRYETKFRADAAKTLLKNTEFKSGKDGIISLELDDKDPKIAAEIANAYVDELRQFMSRLSLTEVQVRRAFFERKLNEAKDNLNSAEESLRGTGVSRGVLMTSPASAVEVVARIKASITFQEIKVANMRGYLADSSPEFLQAMKELSILKNQLLSAEKSDKSAGDGLFVSRYREFKYQETLYELFAKQYELAKLDESREGAVVQVIDRAEVPEKHSKPNRMKIIFVTIIVSGFTLLLFIFVRDTIRRAAKKVETKRKFIKIRKSFNKILRR